MSQESLFYDSLDDALGAVVAACGGAKVVGAKLWPEKSPETAARLLKDCLNPDRPEKLSGDQMLLLLRMGRERGCHAAMQYIASDCGYTAAPIEPEDERAKLQRDYIEAARQMARLAERIERVNAPAIARAA